MSAIALLCKKIERYDPKVARSFPISTSLRAQCLVIYGCPYACMDIPVCPVYVVDACPYHGCEVSEDQ